MKSLTRTIQLVLLCQPYQRDSVRAGRSSEVLEGPQRRALLVLGSEGRFERIEHLIRESIERLAGGTVVGADLLSEQILDGLCRLDPSQSRHTTWLLAHLDSNCPADPYAPHVPRVTLLQNRLIDKQQSPRRIMGRSLLRSSKLKKSICRKRILARSA